MTVRADIAATQAGLYGCADRAGHIEQALDELRRQTPRDREFLRRKLDDARSRVIAAGQDILFVAETLDEAGAAAELQRHGLSAYKRRGCRCNTCRAAKSEENRRYREERQR